MMANARMQCASTWVWRRAPHWPTEPPRSAHPRLQSRSPSAHRLRSPKRRGRGRKEIQRWSREASATGLNMPTARGAHRR
jgi:hypothetical protein